MDESCCTSVVILLFLESLVHLQQLELDVPLLSTLAPPSAPAPRLTHVTPRPAGGAGGRVTAHKPRARVAPQVMMSHGEGVTGGGGRGRVTGTTTSVHTHIQPPHRPTEGTHHHHPISLYFTFYLLIITNFIPRLPTFVLSSLLVSPCFCFDFSLYLSINFQRVFLVYNFLL